MALVLREPKRKHRRNAVDSVPFPIHTEKATGIPVCEATWHTYTGRFNGESVVVENLEDIRAIYTMGCYGKGSLSRGCAVLGRIKRKLPSFISEGQWHRHKQWIQLCSSNEGLDNGAVILNSRSGDNHNNKMNCDCTGDETDNTVRANSNDGCETVEQTVTDLVDIDSECSDIMEVNTGGETQSKKRKLETESPRQQLKIRNPAAVRDLVVEETAVNKSGEEESGVMSKSSNEAKSVIKNSAAEINNTVEKSSIEEAKPFRKTVSEKQKVDEPNIVVVDLSSDEENSQSESTDKRNSSTMDMSKPGCSSNAGKAAFDKTEVVVLTGVESDDEDYLAKLKPRLEHEPQHLSQENLILSLEEAMFLSYALGCLRILGMSGEELSLVDIWKLFQQTQKTFVQRYVAYHYFRAKGWVVKSALKYGGDFALYKEGPHLYHSSYVVVVQVINEGTSVRDATHDRRQNTWMQLMGLTRLAESAGKETLLCQVIWPTNLKENILPGPQVISSFKVQEVLLRRWVASQDRADCATNRGQDVTAGNSAELACT